MLYKRNELRMIYVNCSLARLLHLFHQAVSYIINLFQILSVVTFSQFFAIRRTEFNDINSIISIYFQ